MPGNYEIGVTSGWYGIAKSRDLLGMANKIAAVATQGANYVQVDFENTSEFVEPDVIDRLRQVVEDLKMKWGAHGEIGELMGWEGAMEVIWIQSHRRLHQYLDGLYDYFVKGKNQRPGKDYFKYRPQYLNFHASNLHPIGLFVERFRYAGHVQMDFNGKENWEDLLNDPKNKKLKRWFQKNILFYIYARETAEFYFDEDQIIRRYIARFLQEKKGLDLESQDEEMRKKAVPEFTKYLESYTKDKQNEDNGEIIYEVLDYMFDKWLTFSALRRIRGMISEEEWAYALIAKYLEFRKDDPDEPLWNMFFPGKNMDDLEKQWSELKELKLFDKKRGVVNLMPEVIAMVACRYIIGHFKCKPPAEYIQDKKVEAQRKKQEWDPFYELPAIKKLDTVKVLITFETPDVIENQREGLQRIIHARHMHKLVKAFNHPYVKAWLDSEHYLHNGFDPIEEIRDCPDESFKDFVGFHVGSPKPYAPGHDHIEVGSEAQRWIYVYAYEMRKKGFGVETPGIIIFERGGGNTPMEIVGRSVISIRLIVDQLMKDTPPEKLPPEFYGVSTEGMMSVEKQMAVVREHYWDPLKGLLAVPEEEHTFFSKAAVTKGKREEFKKEELR